MTKTLLLSTGLLAIVASAGCNVHDNTINATANIPNAMLTVTADTDVDNIMPAQPVPMTVSVQNVFLVEPTATVPPEHEMDAGHLEFHLDDETTPPLLVTAQTQVQVPIPAETKAGKHKIICRVHKHDGEATVTKFEVDITVKVSVTTTTTGSAGASGGTGGAGGSGGGAGGSGGGAGGSGGADGGMTVTTTTTVDVDASVTGTVTN